MTKEIFGIFSSFINNKIHSNDIFNVSMWETERFVDSATLNIYQAQINLLTCIKLMLCAMSMNHLLFPSLFSMLTLNKNVPSPSPPCTIDQSNQIECILLFTRKKKLSQTKISRFFYELPDALCIHQH